MLQSAYRKFHSTETVLLKVYNDNSLNIDNDKVTALNLVGLSTAFDTVDHNILIRPFINLVRHIWHSVTLVFFIPD